MTTAVKTYVREEPGMPFIIRVLWFFLIGWHVTLYWIVAAWVLNLTIIGMPLGVWMLNRVPMVLTLRLPRGSSVAEARDETIEWRYRGAVQRPFLIRLIYFVLIGWWFSLLWSLLAWLLCVSIIGLPFGVWMLNRLPEVTTLMKH